MLRRLSSQQARSTRPRFRRRVDVAYRRRRRELRWLGGAWPKTQASAWAVSLPSAKAAVVGRRAAGATEFGGSGLACCSGSADFANEGCRDLDHGWSGTLSSAMTVKIDGLGTLRVSLEGRWELGPWDGGH